MATKTKKKQPLGEATARRCETAVGDACDCRCGGALHGRSAGASRLPFAYFNETLSKDDPHWLPSEAEREANKKETYERRKMEKKLETVGKWHTYDKPYHKFEPVEITKEEAAERGRYIAEYGEKRYFGCLNCDKIEAID